MNYNNTLYRLCSNNRLTIINLCRKRISISMPKPFKANPSPPSRYLKKRSLWTLMRPISASKANSRPFPKKWPRWPKMRNQTCQRPFKRWKRWWGRWWSRVSPKRWRKNSCLDFGNYNEILSTLRGKSYLFNSKKIKWGIHTAYQRKNQVLHQTYPLDQKSKVWN